MDLIAYAAAKKYTEEYTKETMEGAGVIKGKDGDTPVITKDGYWKIGDNKTNVKAVGEKGETGSEGKQGPQGI
jgi:hypothetical protein